jgi:urease accessory protein
MNPFGAFTLGGFYSGLTNPFLVPAHVLVLIGLGLSIGLQRASARSFAAFGLGLIGGLAALAQAVGQTSAPTVLLAGAVLIGLAIAGQVQVPWFLAAPVAAAIGMAVGLDSPPQATSLRAAIAALAGTAVGATLVVGVVSIVAARANRAWQRIGVRILGSWIAASAAMVLALGLAR